MPLRLPPLSRCWGICLQRLVPNAADNPAGVQNLCSGALRKQSANPNQSPFYLRMQGASKAFSFSTNRKGNRLTAGVCLHLFNKKMMLKVLNKHHGNTYGKGVYVGRPSIWGNLHPIGVCSLCGIKHDRADAVRAYQEDVDKWTPKRKALAVTQPKGKNLMCWCAPLPCHAEILLRLANKEE